MSFIYIKKLGTQFSYDLKTLDRTCENFKQKVINAWSFNSNVYMLCISIQLRTHKINIDGLDIMFLTRSSRVN